MLLRRIIRLPLICALCLLGSCAGLRYEHEGIAYSPLANGAGRGTFDDPAFGVRNVPAVRQDAAAFAEHRLKDPTWKTDFGQTDIAELFAKLKARVDWSKDNPLSALIRAAERRKAFSTVDPPRRGDIVLFHNQADRNNNKTADDWLTGCGIVTDTEDDTFTALARTGRGPRLVYVTPDTPSVRAQTGRVINSFLRVPSPVDPPDAEYLAGQLYAGRIDIERLVGKKR